MNSSTDITGVNRKFIEAKLREDLYSACLYLEDMNAATYTQLFASAVCGNSFLVKPMGREYDAMEAGDFLNISPKDQNHPPLYDIHFDFYEKNADIGSIFSISQNVYSDKNSDELLKLLGRYGECSISHIGIRGDILTVCGRDSMSAAEYAVRLLKLSGYINSLLKLNQKKSDVISSYFNRRK